MKTIKHYHWGLPGPLRLFGAGYWLGMGATLGVVAGSGIYALLDVFVTWLAHLFA